MRDRYGRSTLDRYVSVRLANRITDELGEANIGTVNEMPTMAHSNLVLAIEAMVRCHSTMQLLHLLEELAEQETRHGNGVTLQLGIRDNGNLALRED